MYFAAILLVYFLISSFLRIDKACHSSNLRHFHTSIHAECVCQNDNHHRNNQNSPWYTNTANQPSKVSLRRIVSISHSCHRNDSHPCHILIDSNHTLMGLISFCNSKNEGKHQYRHTENRSNQIERLIFESTSDAVHYAWICTIHLTNSIWPRGEIFAC